MAEHIHKVKRGRYKTGTYYYQCVSCPFIATALQMTNRVVTCWKCENPFKLTKNDARWAKPVCPQCRGGTALQPGGLADVFDELLKEDK